MSQESQALAPKGVKTETSPRAKKWYHLEKPSRRQVGCFVLLLLAVSAYSWKAYWVRRQGSGTNCRSNLKNIGPALEMYAADWNGKYPTSMSQLTPNYLKTIPECYAVDKMTYRVHYGPKAPRNSK